jgi:rhodanese-related sulfurtransferase
MKFLKLAILLFLIAVTVPTVSAQTTQPAYSTSGSVSANSPALLSPKLFKKQFKKAKNKVLIDVRTPKEFAEGHLKKAQNIDYQGDNFEEQIGKLDKSKTYYLYCRSGKRTIGAAEVMQKTGFENIVVLEGGLLAWKEQRLPVKK